MIRKILFAAALFTIAVAPEALADERFELTPFVGYRFGGDFDNIRDPNSRFRSVDVGDSAAYGLIFDINMGENARRPAGGVLSAAGPCPPAITSCRPRSTRG